MIVRTVGGKKGQAWQFIQYYMSGENIKVKVDGETRERMVGSTCTVTIVT